jgi:hypothetical protein
MHSRYAISFAAVGAGFVALGPLRGDWWWLALCPGVSFIMVALAYVRRNPSLLGNRTGGGLAPWAFLAQDVGEAEAALSRARPFIRLNSAQRARVARVIRASAVAATLFVAASNVIGCTAGRDAASGESRFIAGVIGFEPAPITVYPLFNARVNGHPARFAFDTGGGRAILVSPALVKLARLPVDRAVEARLNGRAYPSARLRGLNVDGLGDVVRDESAAVVALDAVSLVCGERVDGIIGAAALAKGSGGSFEIDFPRRRLRLGTPSPAANDVSLSVPAAPDPQSQRRPFVWLQLGKARVPAVIDSCELEGVQLPDRCLTTSGVVLNDARSTVGSSGFGGGAQASRRGRLLEMRLGEIVIHDAEVLVLPSADSAPAAEKAVIGMAILRDYRIAFDASAGTVTFFGPRALKSPAPTTRAVRTAEGILAR